MPRHMLPVIGALLFCAHIFSAMAADSTSSAVSTQQVREQVEAKRDQLSGVDKVTTTTQTGPATVLDSAVETDDAPAQEQQQP